MSEYADFFPQLALAVALLLTALAAAPFFERIRLPSPAAFLAVGIAAGLLGVAPTNDLRIVTLEQIGAVALFVILFHGGLGTGFGSARAAARPILALGLFGTVATAGGLALASHYVLGLDWSVALLVAVALAPTDPAAVYAVLRGRSGSERAAHGARRRVGFQRPRRDRIDGRRHRRCRYLRTPLWPLGAALRRRVGDRFGRWCRGRSDPGASGLGYTPPRRWRSSGSRRSWGLCCSERRPPRCTEAASSLSISQDSCSRTLGRVKTATSTLFRKRSRRWPSPCSSPRSEPRSHLSFGLDHVGYGLFLMVVTVFLVRPIVASVCLIGSDLSASDRALVSWGGLERRGSAPASAYPALEGFDEAGTVAAIVLVATAASLVVQGGILPLVAERAVKRRSHSERVEPPDGTHSAGPRQAPTGEADRRRENLDQWHSSLQLLVSQTDNERRVRDGYISLSTRGHTRARPTRHEGPICRKNVIASARPCPPVPPQNLHGKEGVDGSSPSEGSICRGSSRFG